MNEAKNENETVTGADRGDEAHDGGGEGTPSSRTRQPQGTSREQTRRTGRRPTYAENIERGKKEKDPNARFGQPSAAFNQIFAKARRRQALLSAEAAVREIH